MLKYYKAAKSILGLNARNLDYTVPLNPVEARVIADNKLKFKKAIRDTDIPVPQTYAIISSQEKLDSFNWDSLPSSFVLKPNKGLMGQGIIITYGEAKKKFPEEERKWILSDGTRITKDFLYKHILEILSGSFSLKSGPDKAYFEQRLKNYTAIKPYLYKGVPDIRIIVYNKVPIMAELRLPTKESKGKANLHAGGVGVGIDIASGITTIAIHHDKVIEYHPDTKIRLSGFQIPFWDKILNMSIKVQEVTGLGYIGVDIAIDKDLGPVILEINARPGLAIQIANNDSLLERIRRVEKLKVKTRKRGIRLAKELFGGEVQEEVETLVGKKIIGRKVDIKFITTNDQEFEEEAKVDTGAFTSSMDVKIARKLGYGDVIDGFSTLDIPKNITTMNADEARKLCQTYKEQLNGKYPNLLDIRLVISSNGTNTIRPFISIRTIIEGISKTITFNIIDRSTLSSMILIGRDDLKSFLVDVTK